MRWSHFIFKQNLLKIVVDLYTLWGVTFRWPFIFFFRILDISGINCQISYYENTGIEMPTRRCLRKMAFELIRPHQILRVSIRTLPVLLKRLIRDHSGIPDEAESVEIQRESNKCAYCPKRKNRKTKATCCNPNCGIPICKENT